MVTLPGQKRPAAEIQDQQIAPETTISMSAIMTAVIMVREEKPIPIPVSLFYLDWLATTTHAVQAQCKNTQGQQQKVN